MKTNMLENMGKSFYTSWMWKAFLKKPQNSETIEEKEWYIWVRKIYNIGNFFIELKNAQR